MRARAPRQFTIAFLEGRCAEYRTVFLGDGTASAAEMDPYFPGGEENPHTGLDAWVLAYGRCLWLLGRAIGREQERETLSKMGARDGEKLKLLHAEPQGVTLLSLDAEGAPRQVVVYPKSGLALEHLGAASLLVAHLNDQIEVLETHGGPDDLELLSEARAHSGYFQRLCCWIATHPKPGIPYPRGVKRPDLPPEIDDLNPLDYYLIAAACQQVNAERLRALDASESTTERPDWPAFYVGAAAELKTSVALLWDEVSLGEIAATASERSRIHREAKERAKTERETSALGGM